MIIIKIFEKLTRLKRLFLQKFNKELIKNSCLHSGNEIFVDYPLYYNGLSYVSIGNNFHSGPRLKLKTFDSWKGQHFNPLIKIGNDVNIETDCHISAINEIIIDDNVLIASFVYISDHSHGEIKKEMTQIPPIKRPLLSKGPIHIEKKVWIGEKVSILPGVTIGEGSIIGANSVVTSNIPPFCVAAGSPARVIKKLNI